MIILYNIINFDNLLGINGLSEQLLKNHFTLYQGYVANTNKLINLLRTLVKDNKIGIPEFAELQRRLGWEFNGMRLHELYFSNITKKNMKINEDSSLFKKISEDFSSFQDWEKEFRAAATIRGIGWLVLYYDPVAKKLLNVWINEHDVGHLSGCIPLLVMDLFEHAYMIDYGLKKADYIETFFKLIDWKTVENRL